MQFFAGGFLNAVAKEFHPEKKDAKASKNIENHSENCSHKPRKGVVGLAPKIAITILTLNIFNSSLSKRKHNYLYCVYAKHCPYSVVLSRGLQRCREPFDAT